MTRQSARLSSGAKPTPAHKRVASGSAIATSETKRTRTTKATPTKSQHFPSNKAEEKAEPGEASSPDAEPSASDFAESEEQPQSSESEPEDDYSSDNKPKTKKISASRTATKGSTTTKTRDSVGTGNGEKTGLGPGTEVIIKKPKARPAGKTPYTDETLHPNTFLFLQDLKANNNRPWLKMNDLDFRQAEKDWYSFVEAITSRLVEIDDTVPELPVKDVIFRIYRDIRFSPDPTPYKPHFSAAWSRTGRKGPYAGYYVQVSPDDQSFIGGGLWHPDAAPTAAMRRSIDRHPERLKRVLTEPGLRKAFLKGVGKDEKKVMKAFVASNAENALKTKPKGYEADHSEIELLRLKSYTLGSRIPDAELLGPGGLDRVADLLACLKPMITFLNSVVMPDGQESDSEVHASEDEGADASDDDTED
ncbi:hypothetical protein LTR62_001816 [Meristemomyces frigidus]|uniref:DUF2461 domain-containing protein n=1 Tax=Meristemomyces frigidus TaxID=1508187 RepID=A0AAN7TLF6_9PEZI|nr:hypothetical protein LTR62_001816 [Meristemomyces frigidus]